MQLSNRQLFILSYLVNCPQRVSGEHLASQADISLRTLQHEIAEISQMLGDGITIDSSKRGYQVTRLSQTVRESLLSQNEDRQSLYMPEERVNDILMLLLFAKDYTSMEALANTLFLSKASVFRTIESNKALMDVLTISRSKGLLIDLPESGKRQLLNKVFDKDAFNPIAQELKSSYVSLDKLLRVLLVNLFKKHKYSVSGASIRSFRRHLIISILRDQKGFPLEEVDHKLPISSLMTEISNAVRSVIGVTFSPYEMQDCQAKLNNLCTFLHEIPEHRMDWLTRWSPAYDDFIRVVNERFNVDLSMDEANKQRFLLHVHKLHARVAVGQHESNYHKREINRSYPLSVHLILLAFEECFGFQVPETEISLLAMYNAMTLRLHFKRIDCIIVTAKQPSVAWPMKQWMEEHFSRHLEKVEIVEHYRYNPKMLRDDLLVLTTGEDFALSCPQAILVKPFRLEDEYELIDQCINRIREQYKFSIFKASYQKYCKGICIEQGKYKNLSEFLSALHLALPEDYEFVLDTDAFLLPKVHEGSGENSIHIFYLPHAIFHRGSDIRYLIVSNYYAKSGEMLDFYYCLQTLLRPGRLDEMRLNPINELSK